MTKLEAINEILQQCGHLPVGGLDTGKSSRASQAERVLDRVDRRIQLREWHFNRRRDVELSATLVDGNYKFVVPEGAVNVRPEDGETSRFAEIGGYLYDVENNTDVWAQTDTVTVRYVELVAFEAIPEAIAQYIAAAAAVIYNDEYVKDNFRIASLAKNERSVKARALQADIAASGVRMTQSADFKAIKGDRIPVPPSP